MPENLSTVGIAGAIALIVALISAIAERRRDNRKDIEKTGFMPWTLIMVMALLIAVICISLALKGY